MIVGAVIVLVICFVIQNSLAAEDTLEYLQQADAKIISYESTQGEYITYLVTVEGGEQYYVVETMASGYGGPLTLLSKFSLEGELLNYNIAEHCETPLYLNKVLNANFLDKFTSATPGDAFSISEEDGVSGATMSAEAIRSAAKLASDYMGEQFLGMELDRETASVFDSSVIVLLLFFIAAILASYLKLTKARPFIMAASVVVLGFVNCTFLSYSNFVSLLTGNMPAFAQRPAWYLLVFGALLITLVTGRNLYCAFLCPFGAVQEGIYRALHLSQIVPDKRLANAARTVRWVAVWLVLAAALLVNQPGIVSYEPFSVFFSAQGNVGQWIIMGVVLVLSIWWFRLWCRYFCPVGAILDFLASLKGKLLRAVSAKKKAPCDDKACQECPGQCREHKKPLAASDKLFLLAIILINLLIIQTVISAYLAL